MFKKVMGLILLSVGLFACSVPMQSGMEQSAGMEIAGDASGSAVYLQSASASTWGYLWWTQSTRSFNIVVANIAYDKEVVVHHTDKYGNWMDTVAVYQGPANADGSLEIWTAEIVTDYDASKDVDTTKTMDFVIRYTVDGNTYWDNNNGQDYQLGITGKLLGAEVHTLYKQGSDPYYQHFYQSEGSYFFRGELIVKNRAYHKNLTVVYTTDNWATTSTQECTYSSVPEGTTDALERWNFTLDLGSAQSVEFAIVNQTEGFPEYWDNNFGQNYVKSRL